MKKFFATVMLLLTLLCVSTETFATRKIVTIPKNGMTQISIYDIAPEAPEIVKSEFVRRGFLVFKCKIFVPGYAAATNYVTKKIYIGTLNPSTACHELGHFVDCTLEKASSKTSFKKIYLKEKYKFVVSDSPYSYCQNSTQEYFAGVFDYYCRYPKDMKRKMPLTYNFIDKAITEFAKVSSKL